jgi:hypothetical protein
MYFCLLLVNQSRRWLAMQVTAINPNTKPLHDGRGQWELQLL